MQRKSGLVRCLPRFGCTRGKAGMVCFLLMVSVFLGACTSGCGSPSSSSQRQGRSFEGRTIAVSCPGDPSAAVVRRYSRSWSLQTGAHITVVEYDAGKGPEPGPLADLWVIPPARMPHWAAAGKLHEVPGTITEGGPPYSWGNILRTYQKLLAWDRKVYALPVLGDALLCFYREDLFQDAGIREDYRKTHSSELPPPGKGPRTWQEFADIAEYFNKQKRPGIDHPCPGLPPLPANDDELDREFYSIVVCFAHRAIREDDPKPPPDDEVFSFHYDLETGAPRIKSPGFVHGLQMLRRLQGYRPALPSANPAESFLKGEAVLCLASPSWIGRFQNEPGLKEKFGLCRPLGSRRVFDYQSGAELDVPEGNFVPYLGGGGWVAVVPRSNTEPEAAFALAAALGDPETSREIVIEPDWGGGVFRRQHLETAAGWQAFRLGDKTEKLLEILREIIVHTRVKNPVVRLRIPDEREHQAAILSEVREAVLGGKAPAKAMADAFLHWQEIDSKKDTKVRRSQYRLSLGLSSDG